MNQRADVILVSTADWDNPFWTNKQHVAVSLAARGHRVLYIDSQGLRAPTLTGRDLKRVLRRLLRGLRPPREVRAGLWVWSPLTLPLQGFAAVRWLNRASLTLGLGLWRRWLGLRREVLWTYSPLTLRLYQTKGYAALVYHAVDDIAAQPGMPAELIKEAEVELLHAADLVFVTAPHLRDEHSAHSRAVHYFPNVADFDHFNQALSGGEVPSDLADLPQPRIGFIGAISAYKVDFELLAQLARERPEWSVVLIGAIGEGDPLTDASGLAGLANLHILGPRPYARLPEYLAGMDVAILPNRLNDYTRAMFPMKFFEYLAAGRPIVASPLPALQGYEDVAHFAQSPEDFIKGIEAALAGQGSDLATRLARAKGQTYEARTERMMALLDPLLTAKAGQNPVAQVLKGDKPKAPNQDMA